MHWTSRLSTAILVLAGAILWPISRACAGVFDLPHFVTSGDFSLGLEPELVLSNGAGLAGNLRFTEGLNDLVNETGIIGTGDGPQRFRIGEATTFDFFPDTAGQPGIGVAAQALYYRLPAAGQLQLTAIPYIHKSYEGPGRTVEPYFSLPIGFGFSSGNYEGLATAVVGVMFKSTENIRYVAEVGVAVANTESYFSGGVAYYH